MDTYSPHFILMEKNLAMWQMLAPFATINREMFQNLEDFSFTKKRAGQPQDVISFNATLSSCNRAQQWQMTMSLCDELKHEMQMDVTSFKAFAESCVTWNVEKQQDVLSV